MNTLLASKLRLPKKGMIRAAPMATLPAVMRELGADFEPIMAAHGLSNQVFEDPEASVSYETMCGVLAACSRASGCPHIGLLVGQRGGIALGPVGLGHQRRHLDRFWRAVSGCWLGRSAVSMA